MPESISQDESLRRLRDFLRQLEQVLDDLTHRSGPVIPGRHHESMRAAWKGVQPKFSLLIEQLQPPAVATLEQAGLLSDELVFKLSIFQHAHDELRDEWVRDEPTQEGFLKRNWRRLGRLFKPVLRAADVILGSLSRALPLSPAEAIKEYKEAAESGVDLGLRVAEGGATE